MQTQLSNCKHCDGTGIIQYGYVSGHECVCAEECTTSSINPSNQKYQIKYCGPGDDGEQIKDQGWRVYEIRWHKTYGGLKIKRRKRNPRWALIAVFGTREEAESFVEERDESSEESLPEDGRSEP